MIDKICVRRPVTMSIANVVLLSVILGLVSCNEFMPVLIWSNKPTAHPFAEVSAFAKLASNEFSDSLLRRVKFDKPTILVFMEENLSAEDFSWRDTNGDGSFSSLKNISKSAGDVTYLPSVQNPMKGLESLKSLGYSWNKYKNNFGHPEAKKNLIFEVELKEPDFLQDRPDMLKDHDEQISKVYNEALEHYKNVLAIYSGNHNSWIESEIMRAKRQASDDNGTSEMEITDDKNVVRMLVSTPIVYKTQEPGKDPVIINIVKKIGTPTTDIEKGKISMTVRFKINDKDMSVKFEFSSMENEWWTLDSAEILDYKIKNMVPSVPVGAPAQYSYFCNPNVTFQNNSTSLTFENFQVQPRVGKGNDFGPILHCIPYFSIAIWSGLIVVFILSVVLGWGIVMIMDINTNDRFDDPKGKTITISATD